MAKASTVAYPPLIQDLLAHPQRFSYTQAVRLLRLWASPQSKHELEAFVRARLRVRPALELSFAATDIAELTLEENSPHGAQASQQAPCPPTAPPFEKVHITATFLGLYGASSPLPRFYTERLLDEQAEDNSTIRDFLDIFNNEFFYLHSVLHSCVHPVYKKISAYDTKAGTMLMALASYGNPELCKLLPDENLFLRYSGFFFQTTRTETGLQAILADASGCPDTSIECNVLRMARIPEGQHFRLGVEGTTLGEEATLGLSVPCYEGKIGITFANLDDATFRSLLPGRRKAALLHTLIRHYCREPLEYSVSASLAAGQVRALCLGGNAEGKFATLGHDTWAGFGGPVPGTLLPEVNASFSAGFQQSGMLT